MYIVCSIVCIQCKYLCMRIIVTLESDDPVMEDIYTYCCTHSIGMYTGSYLILDGAYWIWRIEAEPSKHLFWLMLKYPEYLTAI